MSRSERSRRRAVKRGAGWLKRMATRHREAGRLRVRTAWLMVVVATCNVGRKAGVALTRSYLEAVRNGVPQGRHLTVIFFQEIGEGDLPGVDEHQLLRDVFRRADGWHLAAMGTREPIAWRAKVGDWHPVGPVEIDHAMKGLAHQTPGRTVQNLLLGDATSDRLASFIGAHPPAGAWNGHRAPGIKRILLAGWARVFAVTQTTMRLALDVGADVFVAQDTNRRRIPKWLRRQVDAVARRVIDRIAAVAGRGRRAKVTDTGEIHNPFEGLHPCRWAAYTIRPKEKTR